VHDVLGGIDGFVASAAATVAHRLSVDFVLPTGLYARAGSGSLSAFSVGYRIEARRVDDYGLPLGAWVVLDTGAITAKTVTPVRQSLSYTLATPGRYRVRAWRTDPLASATDHGNQLLMAGLRAYLAEPQDRGPVTLLAIRMRATNNLSLQASRKFGVIATRKVPVWNGTTWSAPVASSSIAWAIADAARNATYGPGLADARLDLAALLALDAVWAGRGDTFNGRFDSAQSWWEVVRKIAAAGRAKCFMQGGVLRTVRDGPQTVPVALYSMRNIRQGTFAIDLLQPSEATADAITLTYFDKNTWAPQRVLAKLPGATGAKPAKLEKFGIDNRPQALREGLYEAACNRYRRRIVQFETEMEGFIPAFGDLIAIQHDMAGWGAQAEAVGWDAATRTLTLSEPVTVTGSSVVGLRRANGSLSGPWAVTAGVTAYSVILTATPDMTPEVAGQDRERTHVVFGTTSTYRTLAKVISARPRDLYHVAIEAVAEDPSVHTAETGVTAPPIVTSTLPRRVTRPVVSGLFAARIPGDATRCVIGWRPAANAEVYHVEMAEGEDVADPDAKWTRVADTSAATNAHFLLHSRRTMIRVRGVGLAAGPWAAATLGSLIPYIWNTDDTLIWTGDSNPIWSA
jgi:predicted phage tail protein